MSIIVCSVVMSTYNRAHLLRRSLKCYENQKFPKNMFELVVVDDDSCDGTPELVRAWSQKTGIRTTVVSPHPKPHGSDPVGWRDCAATLNYGIRVSQGQNILLTHPEIMVGQTSVLDCVNSLEAFERKRIEQGPIDKRTPIGLYACCRCYYLSAREQYLIDSVPWEVEGPIAVRRIDGFYELDTNGLPDFSHRATDIVAQPGSRLPQWDSLIFGGFSRRTWKLLGGLQVTQKWGSVDVLLMHRRRLLGIPNSTCTAESAIVVHQNHDLPDDVPSPRVEQVWKDELGKMSLSDPAKMVYPAVDEIGW